MMDVEAVAAAALSLPGVRRTLVRGRPRWSVRGRLVARLMDDQTLAVRTTFDNRERLVRDHPTIFFVPPRFEEHMMVAARLVDADSEVVSAAIHAAWRLQTDADDIP
jgi:hypothetical protein